MAAQDLVMRARGVLKDGGWKISNDRLGSGDDISVFIIPLMQASKQNQWTAPASGPFSLLAFALFKVLYLGLPSPPEDQVVNTWIIVDFQFKKNIFVSNSSHPESCHPRSRSRTPYPNKCLGSAVSNRCTTSRNVYNPNVFCWAHVQCKEENYNMHMSSCSGPFSDAFVPFFSDFLCTCRELCEGLSCHIKSVGYFLLNLTILCF